MNLISPLIVGIIYCLLMSLIKEPHRRHFNAIMVGGAGAAYLSGGGFGVWELPFVALMAYVAYRGLESWNFIGIGWLLHTAWDIAHHLKGNPILPFHQDSSLACAICDPVIALWCFRGGPDLIALARHRFRPSRTEQQQQSGTPSEAAVNRALGDTVILRKPSGQGHGERAVRTRMGGCGPG